MKLQQGLMIILHLAEPSVLSLKLIGQAVDMLGALLQEIRRTWNVNKGRSARLCSHCTDGDEEVGVFGLVSGGFQPHIGSAASGNRTKQDTFDVIFDKQRNGWKISSKAVRNSLYSNSCS